MAEEGSGRKAKRSAEHQINKDEDPEGDGNGEEVAMGTFQRASAEVLKTRKIVKARPRLSSTPSSSAQGGTGAAAANPFASLASSSSSAAAPAAPNPFQNVVLSTKPDASGSAPAPAATPEGEPVSANGASSSKPSPTAKATDGDASSPSPASTETPSSATPKEAAVTAADEAPAAPATSGESPKDKEEAAAAAAAPSEVGRKEAEDSAGKPKEDAEQKKDVAEGSAAAAPGPAAAVEEGAKETAVDAEKGEKKPAATATATAGVVSFAALGGVGGSTPFQSLGTSTSTVGGAAPLTFSGFGSASGPLSSLGGAGVGLSLPGAASTTLNGGTTTAPAASAPGPVLSFGSSTGTTGAFSSFTSFAAAPAVGGGWGSPPKDGVKKEGDGAGASGGAADGEKKDGGGAAGGARVSSDVNTKPPIELMDPSEVVNGEELEECTHKARGKLFRLVNKEWVEMGIGHLKVLRKEAESGKEKEKEKDADKEKKPSPLASRLVMRREAGQQVMINLGLQAQTKCSAQGEKALLLTFFTPEGPATYLLKLKTPEIAGSLKNAIDVLLPKPTEEEESAA